MSRPFWQDTAGAVLSIDLGAMRDNWRQLRERVGSARVEGMGPLLIAEQKERGYASQQPEFVLRRPKVIVSE